MKEVSLPAGLEDMSSEIYTKDDNLRALYAGKTIPFSHLPESVKNCFKQHLLNNKAAMQSLKNDFKISDFNDMLIQYVKCNFGTFDGSPDMTPDGETTVECWDCGQRDTCPGEGKVCSRPGLINQQLSKKETQVYFLLIDGKFDKEIAAQCNNTQATIATELKRIRRKLGCNNRIEVMNFALKNKRITI